MRELLNEYLVSDSNFLFDAETSHRVLLAWRYNHRLGGVSVIPLYFLLFANYTVASIYLNSENLITSMHHLLITLDINAFFLFLFLLAK